MAQEIRLHIQVGRETIECDYPSGTNLLTVARDVQSHFISPIVAARVDSEMRELTEPLDGDHLIHFLDLTTEDGMRVYRRSLSFLLIKAAGELLPGCRVSVEHSLSKGFYCEIHFERGLSIKDTEALERRMREIVASDLPFRRQTLSVSEAVRIFSDEGLHDKVALMRYRVEDTVHVYSLGDLHDYFYGYMVPSTGYLQWFSLQYYLPGVIVRFPEKERPGVIPDYAEQRQLAKVFREAERWAEILGVRHAADLNANIDNGRVGDIIRVAEALQEKRIGQIADLIAVNKEHLRLILIAGPSSSGKTTFANRLGIQLRVNGLRPVSISLDDYFVDRDHTPRDANGDYDFEAIEAIDLALFNDHLAALIQGEEVEVPIFNFKIGSRDPKGRKLQISPDQPLIIEGIHGLNERLTESIPKGNKYKIYVSALTQLNIDDHNRIPTTDLRIIRRIVRDNQFRCHDAERTIMLWPSVRRGEERNIFPFQEDADVMFNSSMIYELAVLKKYATPLLCKITASNPAYPEAKRLLKFLSYFLPIEDETDVPCNSILREFVGQSCFYR